MITYEKNYLKELASNCADVEIYVYRGENHSIHTDSIKGLDIDLDNFRGNMEEFEKEVEETYSGKISKEECNRIIEEIRTKLD